MDIRCYSGRNAYKFRSFTECCYPLKKERKCVRDHAYISLAKTGGITGRIYIANQTIFSICWSLGCQQNSVHFDLQSGCSLWDNAHYLIQIYRIYHFPIYCGFACWDPKKLAHALTRHSHSAIDFTPQSVIISHICKSSAGHNSLPLLKCRQNTVLPWDSP